MGELSKELGKVSDVFLGDRGRGIWTLVIQIDFGGTTQAFGDYALDQYSEADKRRVGVAAGLDMLIWICKAFKVDSLDALVGRPVYALRVDDEWSTIVGLEAPKFDGGGRFLVSEWRERWGLPSAAERASK